MKRHSVSSDRMRSVGWESDTLEIEFNDGSVYQYYNVSQSEYNSFINSPSLGSALHRLDKVHRYSKLR